jgi:thiosulfate reductase/polysulfide reductase chain A
MTAQEQEILPEAASDAATGVRPTVCFWCKAECGLLAHVKDGRLLKLEEDPEWPIPCYPPPAGCVRRKAAVEYFYHPGRVNFPLKRVGARGEGKWQRIEWSDALDEIADKLDRLRDSYGDETLGASGGTARTHDEYRARFFNLFGSPNLLGQERICFGPRSIMADAIVGMFPNYALSRESKCMSDDAEHCNPEIGSYPLRTALCRISKAEPIAVKV